MKVPATYYEAPGSAPVLVHVRPHTQTAMQGDMTGTNLNYAQIHESPTKVIFDVTEVGTVVPRNAVVIVSLEEAFVVDNDQVAYNVTVTAEVKPADAITLIGKALPDGTEITEDMVRDRI